jgi:hypothetical protein
METYIHALSIHVSIIDTIGPLKDNVGTLGIIGTDNMRAVWHYSMYYRPPRPVGQMDTTRAQQEPFGRCLSARSRAKRKAPLRGLSFPFPMCRAGQSPSGLRP